MTQHDHPNVIILLSDDQGYGHLGCHGNPIVKTPSLDALHAESVRFTDCGGCFAAKEMTNPFSPMFRLGQTMFRSLSPISIATPIATWDLTSRPITA